MTPDELLQEFQKTHSQFWKMKLYDQLMPFVRKWSRIIAKRREDADDLFQTVFLQLEGVLSTHSGNGIKPYLRTMIRNCYYKSGRRKRGISLEPRLYVKDLAPDPSVAAENSELYERYRANVSDNNQGWLWKYYIEKTPITTLARESGKDKTSVSRYIKKALTAARATLGPDLELDEAKLKRLHR